MTTIDELRRCADVATLKAAVREAGARFGPVKRLDILTSVHEGRQQAICFLRLQTPEQEQALMKSLGVGRFGGEVVFVVDLDLPPSSDDAGPSSQWTDYGAL
ncbi:MAG: RNA-binding protein [Pseudomonadota bacterium]|nr:RNA-binding protein [Pseudomonadota bacterium]